MEDRLRKVEEAIAVHSTVLVEHKGQIDELKNEFHVHEEIATERYIEMKDSFNDMKGELKDEINEGKIEQKGQSVKIAAIISGVVVLTTLFGGPLTEWAQSLVGIGVQ